ncbi:MAG: PilZ domain-containing protein [Afipia felis]|nr:PilZ domain-containing protein [Afipia felis]
MEQQKQRRKTERVQFGKGFAMKIIAIDGSWYRTCNILDVSEDGALLQFQQSLGGLVLDEFFLALSSTGVAFRRCKMAWINGDQMGVHFIKSNERPPAKSGNRPA